MYLLKCFRNSRKNNKTNLLRAAALANKSETLPGRKREEGNRYDTYKEKRRKKGRQERRKKWRKMERGKEAQEAMEDSVMA